MTPVDISGLSIQPLPMEKVSEEECALCTIHDPKWKVEEFNYCSVCFIYDRLSAQAEIVDKYIVEVERSMGSPLERDRTGKVLPSGADRLVGGLVIAERFHDARKKRDSSV